MNRICIFSNDDGALRKMLPQDETMQFEWTQFSEFDPETACVLISQHYAGDILPAVLRRVRSMGIPFAVLTFDGSDENQEKLLDAGVEQIFILPTAASLLQKKILLLIRNAAASKPEIGLDYLSQIAASNQELGAFVVQQTDFFNMYRFVMRLQDRMEKQAQLVTFAFHSRLNTPPEPGTLEAAFPIVQKCLRRGDIACIFGHQILAVLIGADPDGARTAADRIVATYQAYFCSGIYDISYEMRDVS